MNPDKDKTQNVYKVMALLYFCGSDFSNQYLIDWMNEALFVRDDNEWSI